jgi:hypothetical protein
MKRTRSLDNLFMIRESKKRLKGNLGIHFSYNLYESEKVIKVYSVTFSLYLRACERTKTKLGILFSCIYEHEKEQRLSSRSYSYIFMSMRKNKD